MGQDHPCTKADLAVVEDGKLAGGNPPVGTLHDDVKLAVPGGTADGGNGARHEVLRARSAT